jgi:chromosome segregation ATPase
VNSAWLSAGIQEFEQVTLDNGTELFRVRARGRRGDNPEPRPVLVTLEQHGIAHTYEPLSSGGDRRGQLRLAYAVPTELVVPSTVFSLQLPDGYRIELPEPTPGESRAEPEDGQPSENGELGSEQRDAPEPGDDAVRRIVELEQERGELRSSNDELWRRLADLTGGREQAAEAATQADEELQSVRASHEAVEQELRSTRESVAHALNDLELAHAERDAARQAAESAQSERDNALAAEASARLARDEALAHAAAAQAERDAARDDAESARAERDESLRAAEAARAEPDEAPETTREDRTEHAQLMGRLRQLQARTELLRADAARTQPGTDPRLRRLESEREQLATHVRALAELLSADGSADLDGAAELGEVLADGAADRLETLRARAVREANEHAERELRRLRAGTPL